MTGARSQAKGICCGRSRRRRAVHAGRADLRAHPSQRRELLQRIAQQPPSSCCRDALAGHVRHWA